MEVIIPDILIVVEMIFINIYATNICSIKKYSSFFTWAVFAAFTLGLFILLLPWVSALPGYGNGSGLFMLMGFLYLIPMHGLYNQSLKYSFVIMCSVWVYTMFVFLVSFRVASLLPPSWLVASALVVQSAIYAVTLPRFLRFIRYKFVDVLNNVDQKTMNALLRLALSLFLSGLLTNYILVEGGPAFLNLAVIILLALDAMQFYNLFHKMVHLNKTANDLRRQTKTDSLTKLKNRACLMEDAQKRIDAGRHFSIVFIDLDHFKKINDRRGHPAGDEYLVVFTNIARELFRKSGTLYRMSGDEFVLLCMTERVNKQTI